MTAGITAVLEWRVNHCFFQSRFVPNTDVNTTRYYLVKLTSSQCNGEIISASIFRVTSANCKYKSINPIMFIAESSAALSEKPAGEIAWMGAVRKDGWLCTKANEIHETSLTVLATTRGTSRSSTRLETLARRDENARISGKRFRDKADYSYSLLGKLLRPSSYLPTSSPRT